VYSMMLVDDEGLERIGWRKILEKHRFDSVLIVGEAKNGQEAIELAREMHPQIILMDIVMPVLGGIEASKQIRELLPDVRIIVISAYDEFAYVQKALKVGAVSYLLKPVEPEEMLKVVDNEIRELEQLKKQKEKEEKLQALLKKSMPYIKTGFILSWLSGSFTGPEEILRQADFFGFKLIPQLVMIVTIDHFLNCTLDKKEFERQMFKQMVFQRILDTVQEDDNSIVMPLLGHEFGVLMGFLPGEGETPFIKKRAENLAERIKTAVEEDPMISFTVSIGIGRAYSEVTHLCLSYQEAQRALEYKLYTGENQIIHIDDVQPFDEKIHVYPYALEKELIKSVRVGDIENAHYWFSRLMQQLLKKAQNHPSLLKIQILELLVVLSRQALESGVDSDIISEHSYMYNEELRQIENINHLHDWVMRKVEHLIKLVRSSHNSRQQDCIQKAVAYINENYYRDITLEEVSNEVYLNPSYFSRIFKSLQGESFIDYLTRVRLENAKKLLQEDRTSINRIAKMVGYQDAKYFSTLFRKHEGCTPSEFRYRK
jgi:two-component system response regulator YesN